MLYGQELLSCYFTDLVGHAICDPPRNLSLCPRCGLYLFIPLCQTNEMWYDCNLRYKNYNKIIYVLMRD